MNLLQLIRSGKRSNWPSITVDDYLQFAGHQYPLGLNTTWGTSQLEEAPSGFDAYAARLLAANPIVFGAFSVRMSVFSQARLVWRQRLDGKVVNTFTDRRLEMFERPWPGGTTSDLFDRMELHNTIAGNAFVRRDRDTGRLSMMRPDWTSIVLGSDLEPDNPSWGEDAEVVGYWYRPNNSGRGRFYLPDEVSHFAPQPDPWAVYRGMSWLTPTIRDVQGDNAATEHKLKFFTNAATPNLLITYDKQMSKEKVQAFRDLFDEEHRGLANAYKALHLGGGADATVIGKDLQQIDFSKTVGKGETRISVASGVPAVVLGISEGLDGSSLNTGNYTAAKRAFSDIRLQHLWINAVASLSVLVPNVQPGVELWFDKSEIPFLQDDLKNVAEIQRMRAQAIRSLTEAGYRPESVINAVVNDDYSQLTHTGVFSVQLQPPDSNGDGEGDDDE